MQLVDKAQQCQLLREQIDQHMQMDNYAIDTVIELNQQLASLLLSPIDPQNNTEQYAIFLQQNLDWLKVSMAKLSEEKNAVAENMLQMQKGRRAQHSYGQHN
jgi:hypothetical protein